jgi:hypothetical protein
MQKADRRRAANWQCSKTGAFMAIAVVGTDFIDGNTIMIELSNGQAMTYSLAQLLALEPILSTNQDAPYPSGGTD